MRTLQIARIDACLKKNLKKTFSECQIRNRK